MTRPMDKRESLLRILRDLLDGRISVEAMRHQIEPLLKQGLRDSLSKEESKLFYDFVAWYSDQYDPKKPPRSGLIGKTRDGWAQIFRGEYRVSEADIKSQAKEIIDLMNRHSF